MRGCRRHCELLWETVDIIGLGKQNVDVKCSQVMMISIKTLGNI